MDVSTPVVSLAPDNKTIMFSTQINLTTPNGGFIPKSVSATVKLFYNGKTQLGNPIHLNFELGKTIIKSISENITLTSDLTNSLSQGNSISITVKTSASIGVFGITIPYSFKVPDQTFNLP